MFKLICITVMLLAAINTALSQDKPFSYQDPHGVKAANGTLRNGKPIGDWMFTLPYEFGVKVRKNQYNQYEANGNYEGKIVIKAHFDNEGRRDGNWNITGHVSFPNSHGHTTTSTFSGSYSFKSDTLTGRFIYTTSFTTGVVNYKENFSFGISKEGYLDGHFSHYIYDSENPTDKEQQANTTFKYGFSTSYDDSPQILKNIEVYLETGKQPGLYLIKPVKAKILSPTGDGFLRPDNLGYFFLNQAEMGFFDLPYLNEVVFPVEHTLESLTPDKQLQYLYEEKEWNKCWDWSKAYLEKDSWPAEKAKVLKYVWLSGLELGKCDSIGVVYRSVYSNDLKQEFTRQLGGQREFQKFMALLNLGMGDYDAAIQWLDPRDSSIVVGVNQVVNNYGCYQPVRERYNDFVSEYQKALKVEKERMAKAAELQARKKALADSLAADSLQKEATINRYVSRTASGYAYTDLYTQLMDSVKGVNFRGGLSSAAAYATATESELTDIQKAVIDELKRLGNVMVNRQYSITDRYKALLRAQALANKVLAIDKLEKKEKKEVLKAAGDSLKAGKLFEYLME